MRVSVLLLAAMLLAACDVAGTSSGNERPRYPGPAMELEVKQRAVSTLGNRSSLAIREMAVDRSRQPVGVVPTAADELLLLFGNPRKLVTVRWHSDARAEALTSYGDVAPSMVRSYKSSLYAVTERGILVLGSDGRIERRIPLFDTLTAFTPVDEDAIAVSALFSTRNGPAIDVINADGVVRGSWIASRSRLRDVKSQLRGAANITPCGDKIVVAAVHEPLVAIIDRDLSRAVELTLDVPSSEELLRLALMSDATSPAPGVSWLPTFSGGVACHGEHAFVLLALPRPILVELDLRGKVQGRYIGPANKAYRRLEGLISTSRGQFYAVALSGDERAYVLELERKPEAELTREPEVRR